MKRNPRFVVSILACGAIPAACVEVEAPEHINLQPHPEVADPSQVPPTNSHEEARQELAEAYAEIRYLRGKVADLEEDKDHLERKLDDCRDGHGDDD
jgi:hypothetical protein